MMELLSGNTVYFINLAAHHPAQQINAVDALIHQRAAVLCPGSSPFCLIVVIAVAVPTNMDGTMREFTKASCFQCFSHLLNRYIKTVLMASRNLNAFFFTAANDLLCICNAHCHWFFNDNIDTVVDAVQSDFCMNTAFSCNADQFWLFLFDHLFIIGIAMDGCIVIEFMLCKQIFHLLRHNVADCCKFQMIVEYCLDMIGCDSSATD